MHAKLFHFSLIKYTIKGNNTKRVDMVFARAGPACICGAVEKSTIAVKWLWCNMELPFSHIQVLALRSAHCFGNRFLTATNYYHIAYNNVKSQQVSYNKVIAILSRNAVKIAKMSFSDIIQHFPSPIKLDHSRF